MRLLLDTHSFLWAIGDPGRLSRRARRLVSDGANQVSVSLVSVWKIAIKAGAGRLAMPDDLAGFMVAQLEQAQMRLLPIELAHVVAVRDLPLHHRDPFDRLLVAQSLLERLKLVSKDPRLAAYGVDLVW